MSPIHAFVINLKKRIDRRAHILKEFNQRNEFNVTIVEAQEHKIGAAGLWNTLKCILQDQINKGHEYIIVCEDDHQFTDCYSKELLFSAIAKAGEKNADLLCGGVSWFNNALAISESIFWVEKFSGFQFTVIFRRFFKTILEADFEHGDDTDYKTSSLSKNKFFIFPFISVQKDFGYSDVTTKNNEKRRVEALFANSLNKAKTVKYICNYYENNKKSITVKSNSDSYRNITIPTYVISSPEKTDRVEHIKEQFKGKDEFAITIIEACKHEIGAVGLWLSIRKIIEIAIINDDDIIIICGDDHEFTEYYSKEIFLQNVMEAYYQRAEILTGGIRGFDMAISVTKTRFWINSFFSTQFLVLYKSIFQKILDQSFDDKLVADSILSGITSYKMTLFPFISIQKQFDCSDVILNNEVDRISESFVATSNRLELAQNIYYKYCAKILAEDKDEKK